MVPLFSGSLVLWFPRFVVPLFSGSLVFWFPCFTCIVVHLALSSLLMGYVYSCEPSWNCNGLSNYLLPSISVVSSVDSLTVDVDCR